MQYIHFLRLKYRMSARTPAPNTTITKIQHIFFLAAFWNKMHCIHYYNINFTRGITRESVVAGTPNCYFGPGWVALYNLLGTGLLCTDQHLHFEHFRGLSQCCLQLNLKKELSLENVSQSILIQAKPSWTYYFLFLPIISPCSWTIDAKSRKISLMSNISACWKQKILILKY